jgi:hypothetical protein
MQRESNLFMVLPLVHSHMTSTVDVAVPKYTVRRVDELMSIAASCYHVTYQ